MTRCDKEQTRMSIWTRRAVAGGLAAAVAASTAMAADNTLTAAERRQGWRLLFDGTDLKGWKVYNKAAIPPQWTVENGTLTLTAGGAGDLITVDEFGDFDLTLEWKISPKGNSGVIYHIKEAPDLAQSYFTGPEMQVLDNEGHADGKTPSHRAGAIYDLVVPTNAVTKPVGEWNQARILIRKGHIEHWLNGVKVAESSYGDEAWRRLVAGSKFKQWPQFGRSLSGHIGLQDHGNRVWYRNIKIRRL
jgi:hypothetical protein